jgi:hypothetical protein
MLNPDTECRPTLTLVGALADDRTAAIAAPASWTQRTVRSYHSARW